MMLESAYVDMARSLALGLKTKPEFLPLFNLGAPVTTGDSELVTEGMEQSPTGHLQESRWIQINCLVEKNGLDVAPRALQSPI